MKGSAYGLEALIRGLGITALKQLGIMTTLKNTINKEWDSRKIEAGDLEFLGSMANCASTCNQPACSTECLRLQRSSWTLEQIFACRRQDFRP
ncbi:hypothetical protein DPMN_073596 [Dreissena polymorpha]|uniref:Uncharacterized protein n=1 Tax=Dreissena polymorpha TaxID=45954 RepID=A0A9D4BZG4_DREPO|nr:hypothetical protein DPMN_073596 [Dreissena polymorpha]